MTGFFDGAFVGFFLGGDVTGFFVQPLLPLPLHAGFFVMTGFCHHPDKRYKFPIDRSAYHCVDLLKGSDGYQNPKACLGLSDKRNFIVTMYYIPFDNLLG
jgi:hypothetical protein